MQFNSYVLFLLIEVLTEQKKQQSGLPVNVDLLNIHKQCLQEEVANWPKEDLELLLQKGQQEVDDIDTYNLTA